MGPNMAEKADPSQELSVAMGAELLSLDFRSSRLLLASLILFCSDMVTPRVTTLRHLGRSQVNVKALDGGLQRVFGAFFLSPW